MHAQLIVGGTKNKRHQKVHEYQQAKFDTLTLKSEENKKAITIDAIRNLRRWLSLKPYAAKVKSAVILEAQKMTLEAQNALLKTLEEPPARSRLILTAPSTKNLLPTIVSRCQIIKLTAELAVDPQSKEYQQTQEEFLKLLQASRGERLEWVEENKAAMTNRQTLTDFLDTSIAVLRDILLTQIGGENVRLGDGGDGSRERFLAGELVVSMNQFIDTKKLLETTNTSPRLAVEVLLLDLPNIPLVDNRNQI